MNPPVYITGLGIVSPAGCDAATTWDAMAGGRRCTRWIDDPALTGGGAACGGVVAGFEPPAGTENRDRVCQLAVAAADEAMAAAGLTDHGRRAFSPDRLAVSFGTSKGGILSFEPAARRLNRPLHRSIKPLAEVDTVSKKYFHNKGCTSFQHRNGGFQRYLPYTPEGSDSLYKLLSDIPPDAAARMLAARYGARSGAHATVAACATGTLAVIRGVQGIASGQADLVLAGSSDASLHPLWFAAFRQMGVLAEADSPSQADRACRPFDADRRGFVVAEGAAALVLESAESAHRRGVRPLARILGYCAGTDPAGLAQLQPDGAPLARVAKTACDRAGICPADLAAVCAHGTGTPTNDLVEISAIRALLGCHADRVPIVSLKGAIGHLLGAAGSVETAIAALAAVNRLTPSNATLEHRDVAFRGLSMPREPQGLPSGPILKLSMGFGGHLAALVIDSCS